MKGPAIVLVLFGGVFVLLALLTVFTVVTSVGGPTDPNPELLSRNWIALGGAGIFLAAGAWVFGTALRLAVAQPDPGMPELRVTPVAGHPGTRVRVEVRLVPASAIELEAVFLELTGAPRVTIHAGGRRLAASERLDLAGEIVVPGDARSGEHRELVVHVGIAGAPDLRLTRVFEILAG